MITCTVYGDRAEIFTALFGSSTVPIKSAIPEIAYSPEGEWCEIYRLDPNQIKPEHRERAINYLAVRFNLRREEIEADFNKNGMPIIAKDTLVGVPIINITVLPIDDDELKTWDDDWDWESPRNNKIIGDL